MTNDRYLVFRGDDYYPGQAWDNFVGSANEIRQAVYIAINETNKEGESPLTGGGDWYQVVDVWSYRVICQGTFTYAEIVVESDIVLDFVNEHVKVTGLPVKVLRKVTCLAVDVKGLVNSNS